MLLLVRLAFIAVAVFFTTTSDAQVVYPNYSIPTYNAGWCIANPTICYTGQPRPGDVFNTVYNNAGTTESYLNVIDYGNAIYNGAVNTATTNTNSLGAQLGNSTSTALGGGSLYTAGVGISAPNYSIQGRNYSNVGSALGAVDNKLSSLSNSIDMLGSGLASTNQRVDGVDRKAMQGVAIAGAMVAAPMPSAPGKTRVKLNNSYYRGYGASSISIAHRLPTSIPAAITGGISVGYRNSAMYSGGMEVEF